MTPTINVAAPTATTPGNAIQDSSFAKDMQAGDGSMPTSSFSALFKQLLEKTTPHDATGKLIDISVTEKEVAVVDEADDALNALLPFLEAIGLTQELDAEKMASAEMTVTDVNQQSDSSIILAGPITSPVPSQANIADSDATAATNQSLIPSSHVPAQSSPVEVEIGRTVKTPIQADPLTQGPTLATPTERFDDQLDSAMAGQAIATKAEAVTDGNRIGSQPNLASSNPLAYSPTGNQNNQPAEHLPKVMSIAQPVGTTGWGQELGQRIVWMANRSEGKAELVLTPPQMGRVEVSLTVSGDQATASFASANPVVREALESALPRLREALAEAGIQLGQAQVGTENPRQSAQQEKNPDKLAALSETSAENSSIMMSSDHDSTTSGLKLGRGLVDVFA